MDAETRAAWFEVVRRASGTGSYVYDWLILAVDAEMERLRAECAIERKWAAEAAVREERLFAENQRLTEAAESHAANCECAAEAAETPRGVLVTMRVAPDGGVIVEVGP